MKHKWLHVSLAAVAGAAFFIGTTTHAAASYLKPGQYLVQMNDGLSNGGWYDVDSQFHLKVNADQSGDLTVGVKDDFSGKGSCTLNIADYRLQDGSWRVTDNPTNPSSTSYGSFAAKTAHLSASQVQALVNGTALREKWQGKYSDDDYIEGPYQEKIYATATTYLYHFNSNRGATFRAQAGKYRLNVTYSNFAFSGNNDTYLSTSDGCGFDPYHNPHWNLTVNADGSGHVSIPKDGALSQVSFGDIFFDVSDQTSTGSWSANLTPAQVGKVLTQKNMPGLLVSSASTLANYVPVTVKITSITQNGKKVNPARTTSVQRKAVKARRTPAKRVVKRANRRKVTKRVVKHKRTRKPAKRRGVKKRSIKHAKRRHVVKRRGGQKHHVKRTNKRHH